MQAWGSPRNLGGPVVSTSVFRVGAPEGQTLLAHAEALLGVGANVSARVVPPNEGNEVRREGGQGVGASRWYL